MSLSEQRDQFGLLWVLSFKSSCDVLKLRGQEGVGTENPPKKKTFAIGGKMSREGFSKRNSGKQNGEVGLDIKQHLEEL